MWLRQRRGITARPARGSGWTLRECGVPWRSLRRPLTQVSSPAAPKITLAVLAITWVVCWLLSIGMKVARVDREDDTNRATRQTRLTGEVAGFRDTTLAGLFQLVESRSRHSN